MPTWHNGTALVLRSYLQANQFPHGYPGSIPGVGVLKNSKSTKSLNTVESYLI